MTERVDALIDRVMKVFPGVSASAQARYYEAVHQELAPLAREIERQRGEAIRSQNELHEQVYQLQQQRNELLAIADGINARRQLRGFLVPEDAQDLLEAIAKVQP